MSKEMIVIIKKELKKVFGDKRMFFSVIILPALMIFLMYSVMGKVIGHKAESISSHNPIINVVNAPDSFKTKLDDASYEYKEVEADNDKYFKKLLDEKIDVYLIFDKEFESKIINYKNPNVKVFYNKVSEYSEKSYNEITKKLENYNKELLENRISDKNELIVFDINRGISKPSVGEESKVTGKGLSMIFPMFIVIFLFSSVMGTGPDMIAGEKERGTIQTLLITPTRRENIILGKIIALSIIALASSVSSLISLILVLKTSGNMFGMAISTMKFSYGINDFLLLIPVVIITLLVFVSIICLFSVLAKTIKEASTYITPLYMVITILSMMGGFVFENINDSLYLIPVLNSILSIKGILMFEYTTTHLLMTVSTSILFIVILVIITKKLFNKERLMFSK